VKPRHPYGAVAVWCVVVFVLAVSMCAQEAITPRHTGVSQDWSQSHIVFSRDALAQHPDLIYREPRVLHQAMQRWQPPNFGVFQGAEPAPAPAAKSGLHRDWNVTPLGGRLVIDTFPAKFSFDPAAGPDCTNDYVVFGLARPLTQGVSGGAANLVAFNNLYSDPVADGGSGHGLCDQPPFPGLSVMFAYNITTVTGGRIDTSPVLSLDGTKIAFVESVPGTTPSAIFHVLTWAPGGGAIGIAALPPSMTSLTFSTAANDTTSSPWVDYGSDTAYVGDDNGVVYQITGVFNSGNPTLSTTPWPVTVTSGANLTPPVLDSVLGLLMVGSTNGNLYQIDVNPAHVGSYGTVVATLPVGAAELNNPGILAAPVVDITNGTTFVVSSNGGTSAVLVEAQTATLGTLPPMSTAQIGLGSFGSTTKVNLYEPAFDNDYYNAPSTGFVHLCGTGAHDTTPWQYAFGFTGITMQGTGSSSQLLTSPDARCTGWTEFFNPNVGVDPMGTDFFFFGLSQDCTGPGATGGCVEAIGINGGVTATTTVTVNGGPTGIDVDNYSTAAQASSIYFAARSVNAAYKYTQNGLH
jgi:hypothetical protein